MADTGINLPHARRIHPLPLLQFLLCAVTALVLTTTAHSAEQNTAFLPLKINSQQNADKLAKQADIYLDEALVSNGQTMLTREKAAEIVDFAKGWPPPIPQMQKVAESTGFDNVAAGSLTFVGNQISIDPVGKLD